MCERAPRAGVVMCVPLDLGPFGFFSYSARTFTSTRFIYTALNVLQSQHGPLIPTMN